MRNKKVGRLFLIIISVFTLACNSKSKPSNEPGAIPSNQIEINDTLSNNLQCSITIDDKSFTLAPENIEADYTFSDSSVQITFKSIEAGFIILHIPNMYKCPCNISTGYSSVNTKVAGTENEYAVQPTVTLNNYPMAGISFKNLNDGYHEKKVEDAAASIQTMKSTGEGTSGSGYEYLIKGRIHTTVLKNVYESAAGNKNKDYKIEGSFVIKPRLYL